MFFSIIIPVFNRPDEVRELLESLSNQSFDIPFEVVLIEDGSEITCEAIAHEFDKKLQISYYYKSNSGPGDSRNYGMLKAKGDYFLIFDSDCIIPPFYLKNVNNQLKNNYLDCFGGPDRALSSFSKVQKAINFAMTSFLTTGGIRGGSEKISKFQPRSFNMGLSKKAFIASNGFGNIHPGEDPDLAIRLWKMGFDSMLFSDCFVYHKRRIDWKKFALQVTKFGKARPILNHWYPAYAKITFWFPSVFIIGLFLSIVLLFFLIDLPLKIYFGYFAVLFITASITNRSVLIGLYAVKATFIQFYGYGTGFLKSVVQIVVLNKEPESAFPELFFKTIKKPKIIGLTGGIGSGKSTVAALFSQFGIPIYISDAEAKLVMEKPEVIEKITSVFGNKILDHQKVLNRAALAAIVFNNPDMLQKLNAIVHPEVKKHFDLWLQKHKNAPFVIKEAAILFESGSYKFCDSIITVTAPLETRIARVIQRDTTTKENVLKRIQAQLSDEERISKSNYVIENISLEKTKEKVQTIVRKLGILQ